MKIFKTNTANGTSYTYKFYDEKGHEENITLRPGEGGVTEADIKRLHSFDDSEVYYNNKNLRPERNKEEKFKIKKWKEEYIKKETAYRGSAPSDDEVKDAVESAFPRNYNLSLDYIFGNSEADTDFDKSKLMHQAALSVETDESDETLRVRELMNEMTGKQREVLILTEFEGWNFTEISKRMGISVKNVKKHYDNAMKYIEENFFK